ncbi:biopolymer transporter ExbD [Coraliomargarita sp. SDUM461004]|uniref:Biopolymer transporter ExbD n=1 Tax=Thalassobacterium sedimentorum TaxID=3041258 RepID=A0ABU1AE76_9BACT|nr:biopolymer transporter ExbD [Coraliomargarita sp. SDUM461004]MDQ8193005.1 biopolymer transporter ExbD [Coraliomargarita sp. SDUM461004]
MARRRSSQSPEEDFPMTPMIDMVFLLLVFFMTVSTLAQADRAKKLDLPESAESDVPDAEDLPNRGTISLDAEGVIYLGMEPVTLENMRATMKTSLAANPELRIHLRADQATPYLTIKKVLKACAEVGAYEVIYATYQMD